MSINKLLLILSILILCQACALGTLGSLGKKCAYTQDGTKVSSWFWFYKDKPIDLDKNNCN